MAWGTSKALQATRNGGFQSIAITLLLVAIAGAAGATTIIEPADDQLIDRSELVVSGTVSNTRTVDDDGAIWTETEIAIERTLRGPATPSVTIRELGGAIGNRATIAFGSPSFSRGERVLLFLNRQDGGTWNTVDLFLGKFTERKAIDGSSIWYRPLSVRGTRTISSNGSRQAQRDARRFERFIETPATPNRRADYFVENPRYERTVGADFALLSDPHVYRWFAFDQGRQVSWFSSGKQRGFDQGGVPELQTALNSWTGFADANIRLAYSGALAETPGGLKSADGINAVIFNDAHGEIDGNWNGSSGIIGRASYNAVRREDAWTSPFGANDAHPASTFAEVWEITEGNIVIQDGVSPMNNIGSIRLAQLIAHEIGHTLGFAHSKDSEALMASTIDGAGPHLRTDDQSAARWLYPNASSTPTPADNATVLADFALSNDHPSVSDDVALQDASKGTPTVWQWQFGDGATSLDRNPTHRYGAPGVYTVALTVVRGSSSSTRTKLVRVGPDQEIDTLIPVAVQSPGVSSTDWRTELSLFNASDSALTVRLTFLPAAGTSRAERQLTIAPGETMSYLDALPELFGLGVGAGGLLIESSNGTGASSQLRVSSRTFTRSDEGTFGQFVPDLERLPRVTYIAGIESSSAFRTNLGFVNQSVNEAAASLSLYDAAGQVVGTASLVLAGHSFQQTGITTIFPALVGADLSSLSLTVECDRPDAIASYASVIDNLSQDPILIPAGDASPRHLLLPGVAHVAGNGGTFWRTDVVLFNPDETPMGLSIGRLGSDLRREVTIAAHASLPIADLLEWIDGSVTQGTVDILAAGPAGPVVTARTYTVRGAGGTFGQWIPAQDATHGRDLSNLTGVRVDGQFRSNLGLVNPGPTAIAVTVTLHSGSGASSEAIVTVPPTGHTQHSLTTLFPELGDETNEPFSLAMRSADGAPFLSFASVIDNRSGDATFISGE